MDAAQNETRRAPRDGAGLIVRILHCIPSMGGGGAERQLAYLAPHQQRNGLDVHVALLTGGPHLATLIDGGVTVHHVASRGNYDALVALRLLRITRRVRPDVVQTWMTQMDVFGGVAASIAGRPWIVCERSSEAAHPAILKNRLRVTLARKARAIVSNSKGGDDYWRTRAGAKTLRRVIPNAVPFDAIDAVPPIDDGDDRPVILYVGRFSIEKNLPATIEALRQTVAAVDARIVLCGEGPLRDEVVAAVAAAGLTDRVLMPGFVSNVWSWMKRAAVLVAAGWFEGNPNAVLEAIACGCPVVVSDIPSHRELLDETSARFAGPESATEIAGALIATLRDRDDAATRAARARKIIETRSIEAIAEQYTALYRELTAPAEGAV